VLGRTAYQAQAAGRRVFDYGPAMKRTWDPGLLSMAALLVAFGFAYIWLSHKVELLLADHARTSFRWALWSIYGAVLLSRSLFKRPQRTEPAPSAWTSNPGIQRAWDTTVARQLRFDRWLERTTWWIAFPVCLLGLVFELRDAFTLDRDAAIVGFLSGIGFATLCCGAFAVGLIVLSRAMDVGQRLLARTRRTAAGASPS